jgi:hypothetical protein
MDGLSVVEIVGIGKGVDLRGYAWLLVGRREGEVERKGVQKINLSSSNDGNDRSCGREILAADVIYDLSTC